MQAEIKRYSLEAPNTNFMCASACFFIFVSGINRDAVAFLLPPILGVHRPYLPIERLRELSGSQVITVANLARTVVENYLKEMDVPTKYIDQMFSVPKDKILWISEDDFDADFKGLIPNVRDWVDAKCKLTDVEEVALKSINDKPFDKRTKAEWAISERLSKQKWDCEQQAKFKLHKDAWQRWRKETLQNIAKLCADRKTTLPGELSAALSVAKPNQQSATVALNLAQTAGLCRDYALRENAIQLLANHGDAKAQRILGNLYSFGGKTIATDYPIVANEDKVEGMTRYGRAGAQGDLFAQKLHRDLADKVSNTNHVWTDEENFETGLWISRNCPALC
jgi:hypothetical protein